ncbi:S-adenosyl-L-methionine-dependent methyltransferase [Mycena amicta]|nr:S-adenosyl-L-methionine-dependent methyltransferase [Mycena amicta]
MGQIKTGTDAPQRADNIAPIDHAPREYQQYPGSQYILPTDGPEHQRLALQHATLKSMFNDRILFAPVELNTGDKVLDAGTGPGLWIMDLASSVDPSIEMIGVDIESRLFPLSLPKNISFRIESVVNLPSEWSNAFTLVHQRLLMLALEIPQWPLALSEMYRVLRPGGWVQIAESTYWDEDVYPGRPCMEKLITLIRALGKRRNLYVDVAYDMPKLLQAAGFIDIQSESRVQLLGKWGGANGAAMKTNHVSVLRGIKTPVLQAGGFGVVSSEMEYDALIEGLEREWDDVPGTDRESIVFWARKPAV